MKIQPLLSLPQRFSINPSANSRATLGSPGDTYSPSRFESQIPDFKTYNNARSGGTKVGAYLRNNPRALDSYPGAFRKLAAGLSDAQFKVLHGGTVGSSFGVSHRKAFIKGKIGFKSVWGTVHAQMTDARKKYNMIDSKEEKQLHTMVDQVKKFTPEQRETLVNLLDRAAR